MVRLAVIPGDTRRNEARANQPFDVARGREAFARRPKSTSKGVGHSLQPLAVADEVAAACHGLQMVRVHRIGPALCFGGGRAVT
jgi:hypothetical protein